MVRSVRTSIDDTGGIARSTSVPEPRALPACHGEHSLCLVEEGVPEPGRTIGTEFSS